MKITTYSTPTCPYCKALKEYLKEQNVAFTDIDVSVNAKEAEKMVEMTGQMGVPVIDIDGQIIIGFDRAAIEKALKS